MALAPGRILAHGYWGPPAATVTGVTRDVCFATFVLERAEDGAADRPEVALDLPLSWPDRLADSVRLAGAGRLEQMVPRAPGAAE